MLGALLLIPAALALRHAVGSEDALVQIGVTAMLLGAILIITEQVTFTGMAYELTSS